MMILDGLTFDDVLLIPKFSDIKSRSNVSLKVDFGKWKFEHPIIPANMKTITGPEMADEVIRSGGLAILHRFMPIEEQYKIAKQHCQKTNFAVSIGVKENDKEYVREFYNLGIRIFCIDIAHGDSAACHEMIQWIKMSCPNCFLIAGNVATGSGARNLWISGADAVKVGVGPGSLCTTRIETGNGVPQLTALEHVSYAKKGYETYLKEMGSDRKIYFIADGGLKNSGDIIKALCYADMVMSGNLFAGCPETPGETLIIDGVLHKSYVGSSTHKTNRIEGVAAFIPCKDNFQNVLTKLLEGIQSGCSYQGVNNLQDLKKNPEFVKITNAGLRESHPHDVRIA